MLRSLVKFVIAAPIVYAGIALGLIAWPAPRVEMAGNAAADGLAAFVTSGQLRQPAAPLRFKARDGAERIYRLYGQGDDLLVFLHGSASDGRYLAAFAQGLAETAGIRVATLDMRGHGALPVRRGDVDHVAQQEHDIADLAGTLGDQRRFGRFMIGGHSLGGGLAIRYAANPSLRRPDALLLVAPYIHRNAPSARPGSGGWAAANVKRFAGIEMLQRLGVHAFDHLPVLELAVAPSARDGTETPHYSWRLFASTTPRADWKADIAAIACPMLVVGAAKDVIFRSEGYTEVLAGKHNARVDILPDIGHFELATSPEVTRRAAAWMASLR